VADAAVRTLERRWRETRTQDDLVAWLRARLQSGDLGRVRLQLAAHLGSAAARAVLGSDPPQPVQQLTSWWSTAEQLARSTGRAAAEARAQYVLTGQAGPEAQDQGLAPAAFCARALTALAEAVSPRVELRPEAAARAVAALGTSARTQSPADVEACQQRSAELELELGELRAALPPELEHWLEHLQVPEGAVVNLGAVTLRLLRVEMGSEELEPQTLDALVPLCAYLSARACCLLDARNALRAGQFVLGTQEVADAIGVGLEGWVLGL
jgi:hypothetical protein